MIYPYAARTLSIASTSSRTCPTELSKDFFSASVSAISITRSTPPAPITTGNARKESLHPILAIEVRGARQHLLAIEDERLDHLVHRGSGRVVG